jgi:hypothetical protein
MRGLLVCALVLGCGDDSTVTVDGPPADAPRPDATTPDAPPPDAPIDAPPIDAYVLDAFLVDGGGNLPISPYPTCPTCQHAQYVIDHIVVPQTNAAAQQLGCDINGDGQIDNQLGKVFAALRQASPTIDFQAAEDGAFTRGDVIQLYDIEYQPVLTMTQVAGLRALLGAHDASDGLSAPAFYMGQGHFTVTTDAGGMGGVITSAAGAFGPNDAILQLVMFSSDTPMNLPLEQAVITGTFAPTSIQTGKLCGGIDGQYIVSIIIPHIADLFSDIVKQGGSTANTIKSIFDTDHSCDTDTACTPQAAGPCHCISPTEVQNNTIVRSLLSPDLDLNPNETNPFATDPNDPTYPFDALSIGVGFTANHATFPLP